ncbi:MAG: hypothetical protein M0Q92_11570 [Methanoregula sp.]|jgi:hypothetical protein|nr:hypothetical protein [Methanoregula sp.]
MDWTDAHIDNNIIATYVSSSSPPAIKVYHTDGTFFKSVPLTSQTTDLDALEISDGRVYYTEYDKSETTYWRNETVYEFDLSTGEKRVIYVTNGPQQRVTKIVADGDHVVMRGGVDETKLILYTRSTGSFSTIVTTHNSIHGLAIEGDRILWGGNRVDREPGREIHIYTISTGEDSIIPESKSVQTGGYGDLSGDYAVWEMRAKEPYYIKGVPVGGESYDIRLTNLVSGKTRSIEISYTAPLIVPHISGNTIVWVKKPRVDYNNTDIGTIRVYDIGTGTFSDHASEVDGISDFDKGRVVWNKFRPASFWLTTVSEENLPGISSVTTEVKTETQSSPQQNPTSAESPVGPVTIVSSLMAGIAGCALLKKKR